MSAALPLSGICVVELTTSVAGPFAAEILADLGAEVLKIEKPQGGDDARSWGPPFWNGAAATFQALNRNKKSIALDLKDPEQLRALQQLIAERGDVFLQNMRPGMAEACGLGAAQLIAANPRLIYCDISAFGARGPLAGRPGYDPLMQAYAGLMSVTGHDGQEPVRVGTSIIDMGTGLWAVIGILSLLQIRRDTGRGGVVETSLFETAVSWMGQFIARWQADGTVPRPMGSATPGISPYKAFAVADGYVVIAAGNDNLFTRLCGALALEHCLADDRFLSNRLRVEHQDALNALIGAAVANRATPDLIAALTTAGVPCAPLQTVDRVATDPQTDALGIIQPTPDGAMRLVGLPLSFNGERPPLRQAPPALGAHTHEILGDRVAAND